MKTFSSIVLFITLASIAYGQDIRHDTIRDMHIDSLTRYGTKELIYWGNGTLTMRWIGQKNSFSINYGAVSCRTDSATVNGVKVEILKTQTASGVMPEYFSDTIYSSDPNKIKAVKLITHFK